MGTNTDTAHHLESRRETIVNAWHDAIAPIVPALNAAEVKAHLSESVRQAIALVCDDPLDRGIAQAVGAAMARDVSTDGRFLGKTQETLLWQFTAGLSAEQREALEPRLYALLAEMATGFVRETDTLGRSLRRKFLSTTSHDMRSPLNAIIGFSRVIMKGMDGPITETQEQDLTAIYEGGKKLLDMINAVFTIEKIEAGSMDIEAKPFQVAELIDGLVDDVRPLIEENGNTLSVQQAGIPVSMQSDRRQIGQMLATLLGYAVTYTRGGSVTLAVTPADVAGTAGVRFQISDTGLGMTPDQVQRFVRSGAPTTPAYGDVGLMFAQRVCRLLGGSLAVESEVGRGTTLTADLPTTIPTISNQTSR